jgi:carboxyl-terminal processing protease
MNKLYKYIHISILAVFLVVLTVSCEKMDSDTQEDGLVNEAIYNTMQDYYLWYNELPNVDPFNYSSPYELMDALRVPQDKWSFVMNKAEYEMRFRQGVSAAHGYSVGSNGLGELFVIFVYPNSPAEKAGIQRGFQLLTINGREVSNTNYSSLIGSNEVGVVNTFEMRNNDDEIINITLSKELVTINPVLHSSVIPTSNDGNIGYIVFNEFIDTDTALHSIYEAFEMFQENNVRNLVVDLRYNGGGLNVIAELFANLISGKSAENEVMYYVNHNNKHSSDNDTTYFQSLPEGLNLDAVYYISTQNTASASELLINSTSPHSNVTTIGSRSHGKPVGMYVFSFTAFEYVFAPISFQLLNSDDFGDYFDGLPVDYEVADNIAFQFGDLNEPCLAAAYQLITTGSYQKQKSKQAIQNEIIAVEYQNPHFNNLFIETTID